MSKRPGTAIKSHLQHPWRAGKYQGNEIKGLSTLEVNTTPLTFFFFFFFFHFFFFLLFKIMDVVSDSKVLDMFQSAHYIFFKLIFSRRVHLHVNHWLSNIDYLF